MAKKLTCQEFFEQAKLMSEYRNAKKNVGLEEIKLERMNNIKRPSYAMPIFWDKDDLKLLDNFVKTN